jgi:hypothetical protein
MIRRLARYEGIELEPTPPTAYELPRIRQALNAVITMASAGGRHAFNLKLKIETPLNETAKCHMT